MDVDARVLSRLEVVDELGSNGSEMEIEREGYGDEISSKKLRDSRKHGSSKDRKDGRDKGREMLKEREKDGYSKRRSERHDERERNQERRKDDKDREHARGRHPDAERSKDGDREHDEGRGERVRGRGHEKERDRDSSAWRRKDGEKRSERRREKGSDKGRDREKAYAKNREKVKDRDRERGKDRESERGKDREREKEREDDRATEKGRDKEKYDKQRMRDRDRDVSQGQGGEEDERMEVYGGDSNIVRNDAKEADTYADSQEKPLGSQSTSELEERLIKMKHERLKRKADDASEISSWVSKSRKLEEKRHMEREKAARISRIPDEQDNVEDESEEATATVHSGTHTDLQNKKMRGRPPTVYFFAPTVQRDLRTMYTLCITKVEIPRCVACTMDDIKFQLVRLLDWTC